MQCLTLLLKFASGLLSAHPDGCLDNLARSFFGLRLVMKNDNDFAVDMLVFGVFSNVMGGA